MGKSAPSHPGESLLMKIRENGQSSMIDVREVDLSTLLNFSGDGRLLCLPSLA